MESYSYYNRTYLDDVGSKRVFKDVLCVLREKGGTMQKKEWEALYDKIDSDYKGKDRRTAMELMVRHDKCPEDIVNKIPFNCLTPDIVAAICYRKDVSQWLAKYIALGALQYTGFNKACKEVLENKTNKEIHPLVLKTMIELETPDYSLALACKLCKNGATIKESLANKESISGNVALAILQNAYVPIHTQNIVFDEGVDLEKVAPYASIYMTDKMWEVAMQTLFEDYETDDMTNKQVQAQKNKAFRILKALLTNDKLNAGRQALLYNMCWRNTNGQIKSQCNALVEEILKHTEDPNILDSVDCVLVCENPHVKSERIDQAIDLLATKIATQKNGKSYLPALIKLYEHKRTVSKEYALTEYASTEEVEKYPAESAVVAMINKFSWHDSHSKEIGELALQIVSNPYTSDETREFVIKYAQSLPIVLPMSYAEATYMSTFIGLIKEIELPSPEYKQKHLSCDEIKHIVRNIHELEARLPYHTSKVYDAIAKVAHKVAMDTMLKVQTPKIKFLNFETKVNAYKEKVEIDNALIELGCFVKSERDAHGYSYEHVIDFDAFLRKPKEARDAILQNTSLPTLRRIRNIITAQIRGYDSEAAKMWEMVNADVMFKEIYAEMKRRNAIEKEAIAEEKKGMKTEPFAVADEENDERI